MRRVRERACVGCDDKKAQRVGSHGSAVGGWVGGWVGVRMGWVEREGVRERER